MRTKKSNIKNGTVTRTIPFTKVTYLSVNLDTREVTENEHIFTLEYTAQEADKALREMGVALAAVTSVKVFERKGSLTYDFFVRYASFED